MHVAKAKGGNRAIWFDSSMESVLKARNEVVFMVRSDDMQTSEVRWVMTGAKTFMVKVMGIFKSMDKTIDSTEAIEEVGERLRRLEERWIESGFALTRDELIRLA